MTQNLNGKIITIFGGTGFVGRYIIARLAKKGAIIRVITRTPAAAYFLKTHGSVGQISAISADYSSIESIKETLRGSFAVINCLGILFENRKQKFEDVHKNFPTLLSEASVGENVQKFIHFSALGVDTAHSLYAKSKLAGEGEVLKNFPKATILRPSVIFGAEDNFFNMFAQLSLFAPALPLIYGGRTRFQPVFVGDVADAAVKILESDDFGENSSCGKIYELGGAEILTFKEILEKLADYTGRKRALIPLPTPIARVQAFFLSLLPRPLLTQDQITELETDNIISHSALTLKDLHITPTPLDSILPAYLDHYKSGGRFSDKKRA